MTRNLNTSGSIKSRTTLPTGPCVLALPVRAPCATMRSTRRQQEATVRLRGD